MGLFFSCGIEEYVYLDPIETAYSTGVNQGRIVIPSGSPSSYFRYYTIFYRIYISDVPFTAITSDTQRRDLNPVLASHYNTIDPYTVNETISPSTIGSVFNNCRYHPLYVGLNTSNEIAMHELLNIGGYGAIPAVTSGAPPVPHEINLDFTNSTAGPFFTLNYDTASNPFFLFRSAGGFTPLPDRLFFFSSDMVTTVNNDVNADVELKTGSSPLYAYVSVYILATGIDDNYTLIYSRPKHVGIFRLNNKPP